MRAVAILLALVLTGCLRLAPSAGDACSEVYEPLWDPAGFRQDVEHGTFEMPRGSIAPGCRVFEERGDYDAARASGRQDSGDAIDIDFDAFRVVALRGPSGDSGTCLSFQVSDVFGLTSGSTVVTTRLRSFEGEGVCTEEDFVWAVLVPNDGTRVVHAHDQADYSSPTGRAHPFSSGSL